MEQTNLKKIELFEKLSLIPDSKLEEIIDYIEFILSKFKSNKKKPDTLEGIWKDKGFEKITNLGNEIKTVRKELSETILNKDY